MPKSKPQPKTATVLIVDDDQSIRDAVREGLGEASLLKLKILEAEDLQTALRLTKQHRPNVIILDLNLDPNPKIHGGFYFLEVLKDDDELKDCRVIILTAHDSLENMRTGEDLNVSVYNFISKPFEMDDLIAQVYDLIF